MFARYSGLQGERFSTAFDAAAQLWIENLMLLEACLQMCVDNEECAGVWYVTVAALNFTPKHSITF